MAECLIRPVWKQPIWTQPPQITQIIAHKKQQNKKQQNQIKIFKQTAARMQPNKKIFM
jgi:hypothetical protein